MRGASSIRSFGAEGGAPPRLSAELRLAQITYVEKRTADAHAALDRLLAREPKNASALMTKARWLYAEGKIPDALRRSGEAVAADPQSAPAHYLHGTMQLAAGQIAESRRAFTEVLRLNPRAAAAPGAVVKADAAHAAMRPARSSLRRRRPRMPGNPIARLTLARG